MTASFPGFDHVYSIEDPVTDRPFRGGFSRVRDSTEILRGELSVSEGAPVHIRWQMGSALPEDVIWTTAANVIIVSAKVVELFVQRGLSGWGTYPVRVTGKDGEEIGGYSGLCITGRCGCLPISHAATW